MGPRVEPSHTSQPIAQPFENQKHDWPLAPVRLRSSWPAASCDGNGHQGSKGSGCGTSPAHGFSFESTASRGGQKCFPGCYDGDSQLHELVIGLATDSTALERAGGSTSQLQTTMASILNQASFVYENQMNIELKIGTLWMARRENEWQRGLQPRDPSEENWHHVKCSRGWNIPYIRRFAFVHGLWTVGWDRWGCI